ncbi:hypothetical protein GCM10009718_28080 [Isoptericola halotolerans]|uniref:Alkylhydroperoxidase/carboxymuconolactone decarboxylase family protein YurZ n=1 Tax=Isoptericola halotolerans TaxID=300560 RepID=A0ABX2A3B3_9MICO|nr:carboxymuconolactone decarboxylase family protein [Isoptericola halotolerans]NOV97342.1 alkylhydroperoxidase/carboxymuconolactone decarboxylase family protein YurZ [Isoptericola halotolerans]
MNPAPAPEPTGAVDHAEQLRRLTINDARLDDGRGVDPVVLTPHDLALVRIAALVAGAGHEPSYGAEIDAALAAGVTAEEIVDVLSAVVPIVGLPTIVAAAPGVALALGLEPIEGWDDDAPRAGGRIDRRDGTSPPG